jgi:hypothetical protein
VSNTTDTLPPTPSTSYFLSSGACTEPSTVPGSDRTSWLRISSVVLRCPLKAAMPSCETGTGMPSLMMSPIFENVTYSKPSGRASISSPF